jgi:hypothetical protein
MYGKKSPYREKECLDENPSHPPAILTTMQQIPRQVLEDFVQCLLETRSRNTLQENDCLLCWSDALGFKKSRENGLFFLLDFLFSFGGRLLVLSSQV